MRGQWRSDREGKKCTKIEDVLCTEKEVEPVRVWKKKHKQILYTEKKDEIEEKKNGWHECIK